MSAAIVPIVEGQSEVESVPELLRRILGNWGVFDVQVAPAFRVKRNLVVKPNEIERAVKQAVRSRANAGGVLVLLDADDDCPAELGPSLLSRCEQVANLPVAVVLRLRRKRLVLFQEQLPDALDLIRSALQAGHGLIAALSVAAETLPDPVGAELRYVVDETSLGLTMREALYHLVDRVGGVVTQTTRGQP